MPVSHGLQDSPADTPVLRSAMRKTGKLTERGMHVDDICQMVKRRCATPVCLLSVVATRLPRDDHNQRDCDYPILRRTPAAVPVTSGLSAEGCHLAAFYLRPGQWFSLERRVERYEGKRPIGLYRWDLKCLLATLSLELEDIFRIIRV